MIHTEVVIFGKGIAGLILSFLLSRNNIKHVIIDRSGEGKTFGYGETLPPSALPLLQRLGLLQLFEENSYRKTFGYHSCWGSDQVTNINFYHHHTFKNGLKINKQKILSALEKAAQSKIISYCKSATTSYKSTGIQSILLDGKTEVQGNLFVDATGRKRALLKMFNIDSIAFDSLISFSCHLPKLKHSKLVHEVYVESFEQGWGIVSALNKIENVFSIFTIKGSQAHKGLGKYENWKSILSDTKYLKDFLVDKIHPKIIGGNSNSSKPQKVTGENWLALGDAAMAFDPLSSHGITNAIYTAMIATDSIKQKLIDNDSNALTIYEDTINQIFDQYLSSKNQLYVSERHWNDSPFWKVLCLKVCSTSRNTPINLTHQSLQYFSWPYFYKFCSTISNHRLNRLRPPYWCC